MEELKIYIPPPNRALKGTSSWINYFLHRDSRPGNVSSAMVPLEALLPLKDREGQVSAGAATLSATQSNEPVIKTNTNHK